MKKLAIPVLLVAAAVLFGCNVPRTDISSTSTSGNWEARLTGGTQEASLLNFTTAFNVVNGGPLSITGFSFINQGACFATGLSTESESGNASFVTSSNGQVTGTFTMTVSAVPAGNSLVLNGNLTGTSNGTTTSVGTLSNGVVVGTWTLTGGNGDASCAGTGNFVMCQGASTCTPPA